MEVDWRTRDRLRECETNETREKADRALCALFCHVFLCLFVLQICTGLSSLHIGSQRVASLLCKGSIGMGFVLCAPALLRRANQMVIRVVLASLAIVTLHWLCFPENRAVLGEMALSYFTLCLPMFVCAHLIRDGKRLFACMVQTARAVAWMTGLLYPVLALFYTSYSMSFSYALTVPCMTLFASYAKDRRKRDLLLGILAVSAAVVYGSRGAPLCVAVFIVFLLIKTARNHHKQAALFLLLGLAGLTAGLYLVVWPVFRTWLETRELQSRTVRLLLEDGLYLSGRDVLYGQLGRAIRDAPFAIRGLGADRLLTGQYAHNILLELLYEAGLFIGLPVILLVCRWSCRTVKSGMADGADIWPLLFFFASMPSLMVSSSLWHNMYFWIWLGFCGRTDGKNRSAAVGEGSI